MPDGIYSVSQITRYIKSLLQSDIMLQDVWVEGEVSNLTLAASGHCYFTLKDGTAVLTCIMWRNQVEMMGRLPNFLLSSTSLPRSLSNSIMVRRKICCFKQ